MCTYNKQAFHKSFYYMIDKVENSFENYERRMEKEGKKDGDQTYDNESIHWGAKGEPLESLCTSSCSSSSPHSHH